MRSCLGKAAQRTEGKANYQRNKEAENGKRYQMVNLLFGVGGIVVLLVMIVLGTPIGIAMGLVGFVGIWLLRGWDAAIGALYLIPHSSIASFTLAVIPMFILMGYLAFHLGLTDKAYEAAHKWTSGVKGGLGVATIFAAAVFGACCGSSVAATAAFGKMALPQMLRRGYDERLASGCVAAAGTLAALIPPSLLFVLYAIITEQSVGKLLIAGILPGILTALVFALLVLLIAHLRPDLVGGKNDIEESDWKERIRSLGDLWPVILLFLIVVAGIYSGFFNPTEAGAAGSLACLLVGFLARRVTGKALRDVTIETARSLAVIGVLIVGVFIFVQFISLSGLPSFLAFTVSKWSVPLPITIASVYLVYLVLGCFLDAFGLLMLTVPFFFPLAVHLGFSPIWFGVIVVKLTEIGLLTPPVGVQVYVLKSVAPEVPTEAIFKGAMWFWGADLLTITILTLFPSISLLLPQMMSG